VKPAGFHPKETDRVSALEALAILDTEDEKSFDEITQLASYICQVPVALISLVDKDRQWFKSNCGMDTPETPREVAFCAHAILQNDLFVVPDSKLDERFFDNPLVTKYKIEFYAGIPIFDPTHQLPIGTLCVFDHTPRVLTSDQRASLVALRNQVQVLLALKVQAASEQQLQSRLEKAQEIAKIGSWEFNLPSRNLKWSTKMFDLFNVERTFAPQIEDFPKKIHPDDLHIWESSIQKCLKDGRPYSIRYRVQSPNLLIWVNEVGQGYKNSDGEVTKIFATCQDISEKVSYERDLEQRRVKSAQNSKMATLGVMSAGIAHEINNPLAIISGNLNLLPRFLNDPDKFEKKLAAMRRAVDRISNIVNGLRKFSRNSADQSHRPSTISDILIESSIFIESLSKRYDKRIEMFVDSEASILCDTSEIEQVLLNLLNNALDAVQEKPGGWVKIRAYDDEQDVVLQVLDNGDGIAPDIEANIFEPFFTTKPVGHGTGLGLSISKGILDNHNASIKINRKFQNTCFEIRFKKFISKLAAA
jgi:C4-dicarboxylate-specific signal transduction histidine kinase